MPDECGVDRERWDRAHPVAVTPTLTRLKRETLCAALPEGVEPTTLWPAWPLPEVAAALELVAGETLVDLGCGRGEVGLWVAEHLDASWVGVDPSVVGLRLAGEVTRAGLARSRTTVDGHFLATGLDDDTADAMLVLDALHFATDLDATFAEIGRVLRPGRRVVFVGPQPVDPRPALRAAGFTVERDDETVGWRGVVGAFLAGARAHEPELRAEMGHVDADIILHRDLSQLDGTWHGLIAARR